MIVTAEAVIAALHLTPLTVEGGWFREIYRSQAKELGRGRCCGTSIYYLLRRGERSCWHKVIGSDEIWFYHAGAPALQELIWPDGKRRRVRIGGAVTDGEEPQSLIPGDVWQSAVLDPASEYDWGLFGAAVFPGFEYADFRSAADEEIAALFPIR